MNVKRLGIAALIALVLVVGVVGVAVAQEAYGCTSSAAATGGGWVLECVWGDVSRPLVCPAPVGDGAAFRFECAPRPAATATPLPTATALPPTVVPPTAVPPAPTATPAHDMAMMTWHAPGAHSGIPAHEHGDAPPAWIASAGYTVTFDHPGNTPSENVLPHKHSAFKGFSATLKGVDTYCLWHQDFNPGGMASRFHSFHCWFKDGAGGVSNLNGWLDFGVGNNTLGTVVRLCNSNLGGEPRPVIAENGYGCTPAKFSVWYSRPGGHWIDVGFANSPTYYMDGPNGAAVDAANVATWAAIPGGNNLTRRVELALYASRLAPLPKNQEFWTDQFGRRVSGPTDAACSSTITVGTRTYPLVCLRQYVASTLTEIAFPNNAVQKTMPGAGIVQLPN